VGVWKILNVISSLIKISKIDRKAGYIPKNPLARGSFKAMKASLSI
jgi:hypothetical protein